MFFNNIKNLDDIFPIFNLNCSYNTNNTAYTGAHHSKVFFSNSVWDTEYVNSTTFKFIKRNITNDYITLQSTITNSGLYTSNYTNTGRYYLDVSSDQQRLFLQNSTNIHAYSNSSLTSGHTNTSSYTLPSYSDGWSSDVSQNKLLTNNDGSIVASINYDNTGGSNYDVVLRILQFNGTTLTLANSTTVANGSLSYLYQLFFAAGGDINNRICFVYNSVLYIYRNTGTATYTLEHSTSVNYLQSLSINSDCDRIVWVEYTSGEVRTITRTGTSWSSYSTLYTGDSDKICVLSPNGLFLLTNKQTTGVNIVIRKNENSSWNDKFTLNSSMQTGHAFMWSKDNAHVSSYPSPAAGTYYKFIATELRKT